jgi:hypothetical protein
METPESSKKSSLYRDYEILPDEYSSYDLSFKIIVIGNSGKIISI